MKKLGFIGCGNMGEALLAGAIRSGYVNGEEVIVNTRTREKLEELHKKYGVVMAGDNRDVVKQAQITVLGIKPNVYHEVVQEIKAAVSPDTILITMAPSFTISLLKKLVGNSVKVVSAVPNTPAMIGQGVTGICFPGDITDGEKAEITAFFNGAGITIEVDESLMKAVGSVSGSSPAFVYMLIETMADGAVLLGIPRKEAYQFAAKAVEGSAKMVLESGKHPGVLKDAVCSPGGSTIEGVAALEKEGFRNSILQAMSKSAEKYQDMLDDAEEKYRR